MRIDGKSIASSILSGLKVEVQALTSIGVQPTLSVFLVGDNPASLAYIRQKQKAADEIGMLLHFRHLPSSIGTDDLIEYVTQDARNPAIHAVIVQRPIPDSFGDGVELNHVIPNGKDVDGFLPGSPFEVPVANAVGEILKWVKSDIDHKDMKSVSDDALFSWLRTKKIVVIGRGETAGTPILRYLRLHNCTTSSIHSKTPSPEAIIRDSDVVISCVGKHQVIRGDMIKPQAVLVSVGLFRNSENMLEGDYLEADIEHRASYYTPTPGGVGPVNVACLMKNCVKACTIQQGGTV